MELQEFIEERSQQKGPISISAVRDSLVEEFDYPLDDEMIQEMDEILENDPEAAFLNYAQFHDLLTRNGIDFAPAPNPGDVMPFSGDRELERDIPRQSASDAVSEAGSGMSRSAPDLGQTAPAVSNAPRNPGFSPADMADAAHAADPRANGSQQPQKLMKQGFMSSGGDLIRGIKFRMPGLQKWTSKKIVADKTSSLGADTANKLDSGLQSINESIMALNSGELSADQMSDHRANIRLQSDFLQTASENLKRDIASGAINQEQAEGLQSKIEDVTQQVMDSSNDESLDEETRDYIRVKAAEMMKAIQEMVQAMMKMFGRGKGQDAGASMEA